MSSAAFGLQTVALALACGYILHEIRIWRWQFREYAGHILYFRVLVVGLAWLSLCELFLAIYSGEISRSEAFISIAVPFRSFLSVAFPLALALFVWTAFGLSQYISYHIEPDWENKIHLHMLKKSEMLFESHIMQAMITDTPVMVTMDGGKVYIGLVIAVRKNAKWLSLIPMHSGYRDEKSKLVLETDYLPLHEKAARDHSESNRDHPELKFDVTLPVDKIASLQFFDARYFNLSSADDEKQPATVSGS